MNDKLGEGSVKKLFEKYDVIFLTEIKTSQKILCTGFTVYQNSAKKGHRGGIALLIKPHLAQFINNLDRSYENTISFELDFLPDIVFLGCYITPRDSPYYDAAIFGYIQSVVKKDAGKIVYIIGDLNSRVGIPTETPFGDESLEYGEVNDTSINENGKCLLDVCRATDTAVVNNLMYGGKHFKTELSFRRKNAWISEPDLLVTSRNGVELIESFDTVQYHNGKHLCSDHALLDLVLNLKKMKVSTELLKSRAINLGVSVYEELPIKIEKSLRVSQCNKAAIVSYFAENEPIVLRGNERIETVVDEFTSTVNNVMKANKDIRREEPVEWGNQHKWTRLIENNDLRTIWKAIGWNGGLDEAIASAPSDEEFKMHFEELLNPDMLDESAIIDVSDSPYIPILDDEISEQEVAESASSFNENKSYVGITPGIFSCLTAAWILFVTQLLNLVFFDNNLSYPAKWCYSKLVVLFKKGARLCCGNYRGLSIGDTLGKLYGKILCNRLKRWMNVDRCQAGAQEERSCTEHILALRLLIDYAKSEKCKLYILFVDFSKAYDKVPRRTLFTILKNLGCGKRFLSALMAIYKHTINILNSQYIRATIGVKQGGPMSCILFIIYLNVMVVMIKLLANDAFLGDQHLMVLMDDTVLLGSTRDMIKKKFEILMEFCVKYGMKVNEIKTKMMVINGVERDREEFTCMNVTVKHTDSYIYLGSPFTEDGSIRSVIELHVKSRAADLNKFKIFCKMNCTMPYKYKKKVFQAGICSSLLYGSESWLTENYKDVEIKYIGALKALLGVRVTTRTDIVLLETGMPTLKELVKKRQTTFIKKNIRGDKEDTPLTKAFRTCQNKSTKGYRYIKSLLDDPCSDTLDDLKQKFATTQGTRAATYREINPQLLVHQLYTANKYIEERKRIAFTRLRLSSHRLKVETGRWSRIERENRLCECGSIQDESHVLFHCRSTDAVREKYSINSEGYDNIGELMANCEYMKLMNFVDECMEKF